MLEQAAAQLDIDQAVLSKIERKESDHRTTRKLFSPISV